MKKFALVFLVGVILLSDNMLYAQDELPPDGSGEYLDQVPISGEPFFVLAVLLVGGYFLYKRKRITSSGLVK